MKKRINCRKCKNYYVTWDKERPHGCKGMGFKSFEIPSIVVRRNTGHECYLFEEKKILPKKNNPAGKSPSPKQR